ncbi:MAG: hypothetical protein B7X78_07750, partial [Sphingomonadales bacterium 39-62-4]
MRFRRQGDSPAVVSRIISRVLAFIAVLSLCVQGAAAQSVLRDAETEAMFREASAPIFKAAGFNP